MKTDTSLLGITAVILFMFVAFMHFQLWTIITAIAIFLFIWWLLQTKEASKVPKKQGKQIIGTYVGWMVTWMSGYSTYENVRGENAMRLVFGRADIYEDGYIESNPESFRMTYRRGSTDMQVRFNPFYDMYLLDEYAEKQGGKEVPMVDGTEQYVNLNLMGVRRQRKKVPQNLTRLPRTNQV